jgi:hypothetical protein
LPTAVIIISKIKCFCCCDAAVTVQNYQVFYDVTATVGGQIKNSFASGMYQSKAPAKFWVSISEKEARDQGGQESSLYYDLINIQHNLRKL